MDERTDNLTKREHAREEVPERNQIEVRRLRRMLRDIVKLARDVSLTGALEGGGRVAVQQYNRIREHLEHNQKIPSEWFPTLPEGSSIAEVGVAAAQLESFLVEDDFDDTPVPKKHSKPKPDDTVGLGHIVGLAPFLEQSDLRRLVDEHLRHQRGFDPSSLVGLAPFLGAEELGRIIREHLPGWSGQTSPNSQSAPPGRSAGASAEVMGSTMRHDSLAAQLQALSEQLQRQNLSSEERTAIAEQLAHLSQQESGPKSEAPRQDRGTRPL